MEAGNLGRGGSAPAAAPAPAGRAGRGCAASAPTAHGCAVTRPDRPTSPRPRRRRRTTARPHRGPRSSPAGRRGCADGDPPGRTRWAPTRRCGWGGAPPRRPGRCDQRSQISDPSRRKEIRWRTASKRRHRRARDMGICRFPGGRLRSGDRAVSHDGFPSCGTGGVCDHPGRRSPTPGCPLRTRPTKAWESPRNSTSPGRLSPSGAGSWSTRWSTLL